MFLSRTKCSKYFINLLPMFIMNRFHTHIWLLLTNPKIWQHGATLLYDNSMLLRRAGPFKPSGYLYWERVLWFFKFPPVCLAQLYHLSVPCKHLILQTWLEAESQQMLSFSFQVVTQRLSGGCNEVACSPDHSEVTLLVRQGRPELWTPEMSAFT